MTPPSLAENSFGSRATCTTSACLSTAQYPGSPDISWKYTGCVRRNSASTACGGAPT